MTYPNAPRAGALTLAISLSIAAGAIAITAAPGVHAQSNATSTIYGQVPADTGTSVVLRNKATGVARTVVPDAQGHYRAASLPPGQYTVELVRDGQVQQTREAEARVGTGIEVVFAGNAGALGTTTLGAVEVRATGARTIDVSNTNNGVVFNAQELQKIPVAQNVSSVIQLTPGAVRGTNSQYGNAPSIGGSGQSENSFYVNGFPITNILTQVGASELPFGAIGNMQVLTGGYGAEFGRSTGGVVNITTKSGGNDFTFGGKVAWAPPGLRGNLRDVHWPDTGEHPDTDGRLLNHHANLPSTPASSTIYGLYGSGPIIKDKLFFFAGLEQTRTDWNQVVSSTSTSDETGYQANGWRETHSRVERYLLKLDYNITDDHHLEYTKLYDRTKAATRNYGYNYSSFSHDRVLANGQDTINCCGSDVASAPGANVDIFKYTGYLTDDLTVTALYGNSRTAHEQTPIGYDPTLPQANSSAITRVPGLDYPMPQTVTGSLQYPGVEDRQKGGRLDVQYTLGDHSLRAGIDRMKVESRVGKELAGGSAWNYRHDPNPNRLLAGAYETIAQGGGYGVDGYYVAHNINTALARPTSVQSAQYIQDLWQVSDNVLLDLGLRREQFTNYTTDHKAFIEQDNMIAPRLGITWDYFGDSSLKLFANAGRYHLPVPSNLSSNLASPITITNQFYTYTGVDQSTGLPTGMHAISDAYSANGFYGTARDAREITAINLKPLSVDEYSLGMEKAFGTDYIVGAKFLYRTLNNTNDDTCDQRPLDAWAQRNGVDASNFAFSCAIINPGERNDLWVDFKDGGGLRRVDVSAAEWGIPKAKRIYRGVNLFVEHPFASHWYGKIDYTLSSLKGNMEGQTDTIGGGDVALTVSSDHGELMYNANGYLPSDHRHQLKAYGYYQPSAEWTLGGNFTAISGGPRNCLGELPEALHDDVAGTYGSSYFYCQGQPSPRGSRGRLPWILQFDANVVYSPRFAPGLNLKVDVFNLFNRRVVTRYFENREYPPDPAVDPNFYPVQENYLQVAGRQAPREVWFTAEYEWK